MIGVEAILVYKTIVLKREKGKPILCMVPATSEVKLKKLAESLGEKKSHLPTQREAEEITGLQSGGNSPLALLDKGFQICSRWIGGAHKDSHQRWTARVEYTVGGEGFDYGDECKNSRGDSS